MAFDACQPLTGIAEAGDDLVEVALSDTCALFEIGRQLCGRLFDQLAVVVAGLGDEFAGGRWDRPTHPGQLPKLRGDPIVYLPDGFDGGMTRLGVEGVYDGSRQSAMTARSHHQRPFFCKKGIDTANSITMSTWRRAITTANPVSSTPAVANTRRSPSVFS